MITVDDIGWISSLIEKPFKKLFRKGFDVKVRIIQDRAIPCQDNVTIKLEDNEVVVIEVVYNTGSKRVWLRRQTTSKEGEKMNMGNDYFARR
ncbi:hypothetical protein LINPERPRIM_LOCUS33113 [Linum perenne]